MRAGLTAAPIDLQFPPRPITAAVVRALVDSRLWDYVLCHLCHGLDAAERVTPGADIRAVVCARCQRYTISGRTILAFRITEVNDPARSRIHRASLSTRAADSADVFPVP